MSAPIGPGDVIRFTGKFLRSTGQYTGSAALDRWIVQACACSLCQCGDFVATDEPFMYGDGMRHIARPNIERSNPRRSV
jgi:hypothetical protein